MMLQILSPGMQDGEEADLGAEVFRIARDGEKRFRSGLKENAVDRLFVVEGDAGNLFRKGEDDVKIFDRQQFGLPVSEPLRPLGALIFRTVPIRQELYEMRVKSHWPHFSTWPPSAAVRHTSTARITRNC
jgi:hypothetical protein